MAQFIYQVFKSHPFKPGRSLSNTYHVLAADLATALTGVDAIVEYEREIHNPVFTIDYVRVSDALPNTDVFATVTVNLAGVRTASGEQMPLFNTVRLDVNAITGGRPSRWHYRDLCEGEVGSNEVSSGRRTNIQDAWNALVTAEDLLNVSMCQPDGQELADTGTCALKVKQRSMSRRRRKASII